MAERFVIVTDFGGRALFGLLLKAQGARADGHAVAVIEQVLKARLAVDKNFVRAAPQFAARVHAVNQLERALFGTDVCVMARGARVVQHDAVVRGAANGAMRLRVKRILPLTTAGICDLQ